MFAHRAHIVRQKNGLERLEHCAVMVIRSFLPTGLSELLADDVEFMRNIRVNNNAFAFTSMGASIRANDYVRQDRSVANTKGCLYVPYPGYSVPSNRCAGPSPRSCASICTTLFQRHAYRRESEQIYRNTSCFEQ